MQEQKTSLKQWKEQNKDIKISIKKWASQKWLVFFCPIMQEQSKHYLYLENRENETKKFRQNKMNYKKIVTFLTITALATSGPFKLTNPPQIKLSIK